MDSDFKQVETAFKRWRGQKKSARERIPAELRKQILNLSSKYPKGEICRRLDLGMTFFTRQAAPVRRPSSKFLQVVPSLRGMENGAPGGASTGVVLEVELKSGVKVRFY